MKRIVLLILLLAFIIITSLGHERAFACSCAEINVMDSLEHSSTVFVGTVLSKSIVGDHQFQVEKMWKGELNDGFVYSRNDGMCGIEFNVGETYLIFTSNVGGKETTNVCSGNKLIELAGSDIQALDGLLEPKWRIEYTVASFIFIAAAVSAIVWLYKRNRTGNYRKL